MKGMKVEFSTQQMRLHRVYNSLHIFYHILMWDICESGIGMASVKCGCHDCHALQGFNPLKVKQPLWPENAGDELYPPQLGGLRRS